MQILLGRAPFIPMTGQLRCTRKLCIAKGLTENAGHENAGHEFAIDDKYRMKIYYITVQRAFLLNFKSCMYGECVNVEILTAPAHHKYSSVL